jgi:hypothetical protein
MELKLLLLHKTMKYQNFIKTNFRLYVVLSFLVFIITACRPPKLSEDNIPDDITSAFLVLNEGLFQNNNSTITWFHWHTQQKSDDLFKQKNFFGMGDTGNDLGIYGEKIFILMNNSHILHVIHKRSGKLITQIQFNENGIGASPRYMAFHRGNVYVSAFNGYLYKIDTTGLTVQNKVLLGKNPDHILLVDDELWISNSGGLIPEGDSTLSIIDLNTFTEIDRITVGRNPGSLTYDGNFVYVVSRGDYVSIPSRLIKVHKNTKTLIKDEELALSSIHYFQGKLYKTGYYFESNSSVLHEIDPVSFENISPNLIAHLNIQTLYGFQQLDVFGQPVNVILDARQFVNQGKVVVCDPNFSPIFEFTAGLNPSKIVFNAP